MSFACERSRESAEPEEAYFDVPVEQQLLSKQGHVFVLELVSRQQFGGAVAELQTVAFGGALRVAS